MSYWIEGRDGDPGLIALYNRHYSAYKYADGRVRTRCVGPGQRLVLTTLTYNAACVWRKFRSQDAQYGINCAIFRNEGVIDQDGKPVQSSTLLREAMVLAFKRWPGQRLYTYVNPRAIKSANPGYCFKVCGWRQIGITKKRHYIILEYLPPALRLLRVTTARDLFELIGANPCPATTLSADPVAASSPLFGIYQPTAT
jgi:hypothetical protein